MLCVERKASIIGWKTEKNKFSIFSGFFAHPLHEFMHVKKFFARILNHFESKPDEHDMAGVILVLLIGF